MSKTDSSADPKNKNKGGHPGGPNRRTKFVAERLARDGGVTPLEVMVGAMRFYFKRAHIDGDGKELKELNLSDLKEAAGFAQMAAPYIHPRLATHEVSGKGGGGIAVAVSGSVTVYLPDNGRRTVAKKK